MRRQPHHALQRTRPSRSGCNPRLPLAYVLTVVLDHGLLGAWLAMFVDIYVCGAFFLWRFAGGKWKTARV